MDPLRGLARHRERYYAVLDAADHPRRGDLDGRGNLSDAALTAFCVFFLETMLDQIRFMGGLLDLPALRTRVERYFQFETLALRREREPLMRIVRTLVDEGEISRTRVQDITGKGATLAARLIKRGLDEGYFTTPTPKGPPASPSPPKPTISSSRNSFSICRSRKTNVEMMTPQAGRATNPALRAGVRRGDQLRG